MMYEQNTVRTLYKRLLSLYPRAFREQVGESMEQTFNDLCYEKRKTRLGLFSFVLWIFIETMIGILKEHLLIISQGDIMQTIFTNLKLPTIISFLIVLPFMIMEVVNRRNFNEGFPAPLFIVLWLLPVLFILTGMPIVRSIRAGEKILAHPVSLFLRVLFMIALAWAWGIGVIDQWPCFMGVPNCD